MGLQIYLGGLRKIGVWLFLCPLGLGAIQWDLSDADAELDYETDLFSILEINVSGDFDGDTKNEIAYSFGTSGRAIYGSHFPAYSKLSSIRTTKLLNSDLSFKIKGTADLDGDSLDDWVISINAGEIEVVWGRSYPPAQLELSSPQNLIIKLPGPEHYFYYYTVGDFNGDGREDLVIGSPEIDPNPGRVYIFRGRSRAEMSGATFRTDDPSFGLTLIGAGRIRFGGHVAVGDVNGDGYDELVLSDDSRTSMGRSSAGEVYIVRGSSVFPTGTASVTDRAFRTIVGPAPSPRAANIHADMVSDFSGDGMADVGLIVNDTPVLVNGADIWAFGPTIDLQPGQSNEVHKMVFQDPLGRSGTWAGSGDFDGDGRADLSLQWYKYTTPTSKVSLYLSHSFSIGNPWPTTISTASIDIEYLTMIDHVSGLGDINGDGKSDLVMTASGVPDDIRIFYGFTPLENPSIRVADRAPDQARVHLSLSVDGDPTEMKLSGNFLDAIKDQWVPFQGDVDLTLSPSEENKTITVVFRNSLLRESEPVSASLSLAAGSTGTSVVTNLLREGGTALFEIRLEAPSHLKAAVYSREARLLRTLINETKSAGVHVVEWDGANNEGQRVAPGVYTVVVDRDGQIDPRRVLVK